MADDQDDRERLAPVEGAEPDVVRVGGEMDYDRAPLLCDVLRTAITRPGGPVEIVADLSDLTFCDSAGLNSFVRAHHLARRHGRRLRLHAPRPQVMHLLEISGVEKLFLITARPAP
ncbi:STAS domain-containing protein [Streptomyces subrutilus]|uniref:Anti-sigma factor antagonist n=1 Tax=Streptomyces subrutilus TaxID=36818 RepID=A0A5P2UNR2_9ACTN|nr:STAS domain-containing protein [Streptomyces subrutilus]QEU80798.1 anti-sigma factor antagonist [Streptomyces subrutilus]WSJ29910.1 STAS domain-containing protein [Streptomyces subrutilus]GGZ99317.1 hypothetical protein GCM10010371_68510 [Streptomyces subrutilus]